MAQDYQNVNSYGATPWYMGMNPTQATAQGVQVSSWLPNEVIRDLQQHGEQFSFAVDERERNIAICNHRDQKGNLALNPDPVDGKCVCGICGEKFNLCETYTTEDVTQAVNIVLDILQTTKLMYLSLDSKIGTEFYQIIAFIKKIPKIFQIASNDFKKYENVFGLTPNNPQSAFAIFGSLSNPGYGMGYNMPQYTGYAQPNPQMQGQPAQFNNAAPAQNPFYQQPNQQYAPNGYQYGTAPWNQPSPPIYGMNPQQAPQQPQTAAPSPDVVQQSSTLPAVDQKATVSGEFKA